MNHRFVTNLLQKEAFAGKRIADIKTSDAKLFLIKLQQDDKTLQYLMGHSDISVTLNTYTHLGLEDAQAELHRMEEVENVRKEQEKFEGNSPLSQMMFKVV